MKDLVDILKQHASEYSPVVPFKRGTDRLLAMDFTAANAALTPNLLADTKLFSEYINTTLQAAGAVYGIGGYGEHRTIYSRSNLFDNPGEEPRRLHLGMDIWGKPNTAVMAPLDGILHSYAFNNHPGDYGATIILVHQLEGISFFTLYGHLSLDSIKNLEEGITIRKGDVFAEFGLPYENGQWPPHLHFQLIADMQGRKGDYPGVCKYGERESWMANSPDPDLVLKLGEK